MTYEAMIAETVTIEGDGNDPIPAYLARPLGPGPFPSVVVLHHRAGWDWASKEIVRRLASEGYAAIMPHLHHRDAPGAPDSVAAEAAAKAGVSDARVLGDTVGAQAFIRRQPYANGRVGLLGFCSGGRQAYMVACSAQVDATVVCYGGRIAARPQDLHDKMPVAAIDMTPSLSGPVLGLFGALDTKPSPADVTRLRDVLESAGKTYRFRTFADTGHAFFAVDRGTYNPTSAQEGWTEIFGWFADHLRD